MKNESKLNPAVQIITERFLAMMEQGIIPWKQPWMNNIADTSRYAVRRASGRPYSFLNQLLLAEITKDENGKQKIDFGAGEWATFKEWNEAGYHVRKGETSKKVVWWKPFKSEAKDENGLPMFDDNGEAVYKVFFTLKYISVFHASQVMDEEGNEPKPIKHRKKLNEKPERVKSADEIISEYIEREKIIFMQGYNEAFYAPASDMICVPSVYQYKNTEDYYSTTFHEITHSTGHVSRLNRLNQKAAFGNEVYTKEELVAEMGSAILCGYCGIISEETEQQHAAYLQNWMNAIKAEPEMLVSAATKAEKAAAYVVPGLFGDSEEE